MMQGPIQPLTQDQLLGVLEALLPDWYLGSLERNAPEKAGYEILQQAAAIFEEVSSCIAKMGAGFFFLSASGGKYATTPVLFFRQNASAGAVTVKAGTVIRASASGRSFVTTSDAVFGASDVGPVEAQATAALPGWSYNLRGQRTTAAGEILPGELDKVVRPIQSPSFGDPTIQVRQEQDAVGGVAPMLDLLGHDRGTDRLPGEPDDAYLARCIAIADTISPGAIERCVDSALTPRGIPYAILELWDIRYQTCWDAPDDLIPGSDFDPTLFCFDDPRIGTDFISGFRNRWLDDIDVDGSGVVIVPEQGPLVEMGMAYDDPVDTPGHLTFQPQGQRAVSAFDLPDSFDVSVGAMVGAYDGDDTQANTIYSGLFQTLQKIKAFGTSITIELAGE